MMGEETSAPLSSNPLGLDEAYSVKTPDDNRRLYAKWASTYESEFVEKKRYRYPKAIAEVFSEKVPLDVLHVVDVGTGTGLTGTYLVAHRPEMTIDGIDISPEMLEQAKAKARFNGKPVYRDLFERDLTQEVLLTRDPYDALICSGTFTHGHLGPEAIENLTALVRHGGWLVIGVNNEHFIARGFEGYLAKLTAEAVISEPIILRVDVYEEGSIHRGDQARILIFMRK
ncbi:MAG: class I SAM-dependent methyltransferase [Candidatus Nanopelagicaceae bacterium]|nr:class I SAM-dependent methyltransferase [Candidatus Nanopelagicaceae bacterium]